LIKNLKIQEEIIANWKGDITKPVVSAICSAYNHESYIAEAIEGFLIQETDFPFEIIIHDDASTDKTADIIRKYETLYPKLIRAVYQTENRFSQGKRNGEILYPMSKGKYVALCDGDDYWTDPLKLQKQVVFLKNNEDYVCCFHNSIVIDGAGHILKKLLLQSAKDYSEIEMLSANAFITTHSVMFKNIIDYDYGSSLNKVPFGDVIIWHLLGYHGKAKYLGSIKNTVYRVHLGGVWSRLDKYEKFKKTLLSKTIIEEKLRSEGIKTEEVEKSISDFIVSNLKIAIYSFDYKLFFFILKNFKDRGYNFFSTSRILIVTFFAVFKQGVKYFLKL